MATKQTKSRSKVAKPNQLTFRFHWWMVVILVLFVALVGLAVLRFSRASSSAPDFAYNGKIVANYYGVVTIQYGNKNAVNYTYKPISKDSNGVIIYKDAIAPDNVSGSCMYLTPNGVGAVGTGVIVTPSLCFK